MFSAMSLPQLATQVKTESLLKTDLVAPIEKIWASSFNNTVSLTLQNTGVYTPTVHAHNQIASFLDIPSRYYQRMLRDDQHLLTNNVNRWLDDYKSDSRLLRASQSSLRAFLSPSYRRLDNDAAIEQLYPVAMEYGCEVVSCDVSETKMYLKLTTPRLQGEVKVGDLVQSGIVISNSEVGAGCLTVQPLIYRLCCLNGMVINTAQALGLKRRHLGARVLADGIDYQILSSETQALSDKALWAQVQDTVRYSLSEAVFSQTLQTLQLAESAPIKKPLEIIELAQKRLGLSDDEKTGVLDRLIVSGSPTVWSLANAVTNLANSASSYERATELETLGWNIVASPIAWSN